MCAACPSRSSVSYLFHCLRIRIGSRHNQSIKDLIKYPWRVRRTDTDDTSSQKSVDLIVNQRAVYASY